MPDFHSNFQSYFTEEERRSELYRILAMIGVNIEKTVYEELNAEIRRATEAIVFPDQKLRSWLAFFLTPVRNVISARGNGRIVVTNAKEGFTISAGSMILGKNGKGYQLNEDLTLAGTGDSLPFSFIQGTESSHTTAYSEFISIPVVGVDLSSVKVTVAGKELPLVLPFPSYSQNIMTNFGSLLDLTSTTKNIVLDYLTNKLADIESSVSSLDPEEQAGIYSSVNEIISFVGDKLVGISQDDADTVLKALGSNLNGLDSLWSATTEVSVRPYNGFFPFYYNNTLYIKIYPGVDVDVPDHQEAIVTYRVSDGALGNIGKDQFREFDSSIEAGGELVEYELSNDVVTNGVNPPSHAELANLLRRRFFSSTHVSSVPEYTSWFLSQPGVGDCMVVSDFERWRMSGRTEFTGEDITGTVDVYLVRDNGSVVIPNTVNDKAFTDSLLTELDAVRDIAFIDFRPSEIFWHFYTVQFKTSINDKEFISYASSALNTIYSVEWVKQNGTSLYKALDLEYVTREVKGVFEPSGLRVVPYHYYEVPYLMGTTPELVGTSKMSFQHYHGEKPGGWYEYWTWDEDEGAFGYKDPLGKFIYEPFAVFREYLSVAGVCNIYRYKKKYLYVNGDPYGWDWSELYGNTVSSNVGSRDTILLGSMNSIKFDLPADLFEVPGVLRCFWCIENDGVMPVGGSTVGDFGVRKLPVSVPGNNFDYKDSSNTFFGEGVRFEKYF